MFLRRIGTAVAAFLLMGAAPQDALVRARQLYNQQKYDAAIVAAREAAQSADLVDAARVVLARAHLERYRSSDDLAHLAAARESLTTIDAGRLTSRDRNDLTIGYGVLFYFDGRYGAAAEMFAAALRGAAAAGPIMGDTVLDWWAIALDRQAQSVADSDRRRIYARVLERMETAITTEPPSAAAAYWLAAASIGADDPERAWHAAITGWILAPLAVGPRASLRADLERLVQQAVIPLRARAITAGGDTAHAIAAMQSEWAAVKELGIRR